jgi:hypothetical protein
MLCSSEMGDTIRTQAERERRDIILVALWGAALGLIVAWVSVSLRLATRPDTLHNLAAVLDQRPFRFGPEFHFDLPFYNRILFPLIYRAAVRAVPAVSDSQWYLLLRVVSFQAAFSAFVLVSYLNVRADRVSTCFVSSLLALVTIAGFNFPWEDTSEALDIVGLCLGVGAALRRWFLACLALSLLFALNRESATFLGIIWFCLIVERNTVGRCALEGAAICGLSYALSIAIRKAMAPVLGMNWNMFLRNIDMFLIELQKFNPLGWIWVLAALLLMLCVFLNWKSPLARRFILVGLVLLAPAVWFGTVSEIRVYVPSFLMLAFAVVAGWPADQDATQLRASRQP